MSAGIAQAADDLAGRVSEIEARLRCLIARSPTVGIVLGTGLGGFADDIERPVSIAYDQIPHFPRATALGHKGQLTFGSVSGVPVVVMEGRFHRYEGYPEASISLPVRVMRRLGIGRLIVTNACGGLHPNHEVGDLVVIEDHIDLMFRRAFQAPGDKAGLRHPCAARLYDTELRSRALEVARQMGVRAHSGVYVAVTGPNYETRAEYRCFRRLGGDVVGMSTVPEVMAAAQLGLRVLGLSTVTNVCRPDALGTSDGAAVAAAARAAAPRLRSVLRALLDSLQTVRTG